MNNGRLTIGRQGGVTVGGLLGMLVVVAEDTRASDGRKRWLCRCECGHHKVVRETNLKGGRTTSCGCINDAKRCEVRSKHRRHRTAEYRSWECMLRRCRDRNYENYPDYGGRGIEVCEQWREFKTFLRDMGERPAGKTLDRIDNEGNYEPGNCRWATPLEQAANRRPQRPRAARCFA